MQVHKRERGLLLNMAVMLLLSTTSLMLGSCGGGDIFLSGVGVGTGGTGFVSGTVTGLGSVIVDGVRYDDSKAVLERKADLVQTEALGLSDLQVGQFAALELDSQGALVRVRIDAQLLGPVGSVVAASRQLTVWGQTVLVNTDPGLGPVTVFSGYSGISDVAAQDRVQVYGVLQPDPIDTSREFIRATRIEHLVSTSTLPARLTGTLSSGGATGLMLAGLALDTSQAVNLASGQTLSAGSVVTVVLPWSQSITTPTTRLLAQSVRVVSAADVGTNSFRLSGAVQLKPGGTLLIQGVAVDASDATLAAVRDALAQGTYITVTGQVSQTSGRLVVSAIETTPTGGRPQELRGSVTSMVDAKSFMVRGMWVSASAAQWVGGAATDLVTGRYVELTGSVSGNVFNASKVVLQAGLPDTAVLDVTGLVQAVDNSSRVVRVLTQDGQAITITIAAADALPSVGQTVRSEGFWKDGRLQSQTLSNTQSPEGGLTLLEGIVDKVSAGQFRLNGLQISVDTARFPALRIVGGERVEVWVKLVDGQYQLVDFKAKPPRL
jgi:hypothetical protein